MFRLRTPTLAAMAKIDVGDMHDIAQESPISLRIFGIKD